MADPELSTTEPSLQVLSCIWIVKSAQVQRHQGLLSGVSLPPLVAEAQGKAEHTPPLPFEFYCH